MATEAAWLECKESQEGKRNRKSKPEEKNTLDSYRLLMERIGAVVYAFSQRHRCLRPQAWYGRLQVAACLIPCRLVFEKGNHSIPVTGGFLRKECQKLFSYRKAY